MRNLSVMLGQSYKGGFFTSLALAIGAGVASGGAISNAMKPKSSDTVLSQPRQVTDTPSTSESIQQTAKDTASEEALKKRRQRTKTVLTGPRGPLVEPATEKKTLLGG